MTLSSCQVIAHRLAGYNRVVEVGIGTYTDVAVLLTETADVIATDIVDREVPAGIEFFRDDITNPTPSIYAGADLLYARNLPPELHRSTYAVACEHDAAFVFTTLGTDPPAISDRPEMLPGETLYWAYRSPNPGRAKSV